MLIAEVEVVGIERVSPGFVRVELGAPALADFGVGGPLLDVRVKLLFPTASGSLPDIAGSESWYPDWLALPEEERGHLRTFTVREVRGTGAERRIVVDFAVHEASDIGPAARWALTAETGDRLVLVGPREGSEYGGIEFAAPSDARLLLVGDETAVPAVAGIVSSLPAGARGVAFLEVADGEDVQVLDAPEGVDVRWLPRNGSPVGTRLVPVVRRELGLAEAPGSVPAPLAPDAVDVWETPTYSAAGEAVATDDVSPGGAQRRYAWIAGESTVVRTLRRSLVGELGWDRGEVCFMGYWRQGVAMRS